ncbi:hypothetical protein MBLNU230_g7659t1 [Neophaeotheca triangularis]
MRFGKQLQQSTYEPWKGQYIDYAKLKKLLKEDESRPGSPERNTSTGNDEWTEDDEGAFVDELVNTQLEKVHSFHKDTREKLQERAAKCESKLDGINGAEKYEATETGESNANGEGSNGKKAVPSESTKQKVLEEVLSELDNITKETNELEKYSRINYAGFLKAAKKHDRKRGHAYRVRPLLQVRLSNLPFNKEDYSPLLYRLSAMYSFVRQNLEGAEDRGKSMSSSQHTAKEDYVSHKFWVHPENLLEVKTQILRRLPVLVYNPQTEKVAEGNQPDPSITSIYFDNPSFNLYSNKVDHGTASSLRLRWYGQLKNRPQIWMEKKTVRDDDTSAEEKLRTKDKYVQPFISGQYKMDKQIGKMSNRAGPESDEVQQLQSAVSEIQSLIKENNLQPVLRANYTRTAFQIPGDDRVRISLDTDLAFIREDALDTDRPCRDPDSWHRTDIDDQELGYPFKSIRKGEITRFPFALLEVKIRNSTKKSSEWIDDLMTSHLVKPAPRFSKFVHGVAQLFEDYVNTFPFWLSEVETDIRRDPEEAFHEEQAKKQKERDDEFAVGSLLKSSHPSGGSPRSKPQRSKSSAIISPVGSPSVQNSSMPAAARKSSTAATAQQTAVTDVAEEADEDETGAQTLQTSTQPPASSSNQAPSTNRSKLKDLLPSFSTSKYSRRHRSATPLPPGVSAPETWIKDAGPVKVEAKVWLANQRTFVKWQHVSVLLASLSLGLYNAAGVDNNIARGLAVVYTLVAVFAGVWGWGVYVWRSRLIEGRSGRDFDALLGPVVVCVGLMVALVLNFGFKYQALLNERERVRVDDNAFSGFVDQSQGYT